MQLPPQVRRELEAFLAQLNEGYLYVEHNEDGTHGDITANSITLVNPTEGTGENAGAFVFYDEHGRAITLDGTDSERTFDGSTLRIQLEKQWGGVYPGGTALQFGLLHAYSAGNADGAGIFIRELSSTTTSDGWAITASPFDLLLTGRTMLAFTDTRDNHIVFMVRPVGAPGAITQYVVGPQSDVHIGTIVTLGKNSTGDRWDEVNAIEGNLFEALILGLTDTTGVRLDLDAGTLEVREGDDSGYADIKAGVVYGETALITQNASSFVGIGPNSTAGGRIKIESGAVTFREGDDSAYNTTRALAYVEANPVATTIRSTALGYWDTYTYSAGNFTASGSMTWGVDDGDEVFSYSRVGSTLIIQGFASSSDVGGTASNGLRLTLPASLVGATGMTQRGPIMYQDAGGANTYGYWEVATGSTFIEFFKLDAANWTLTTGDNTYVHLMNTSIQVNIT